MLTNKVKRRAKRLEQFGMWIDRNSQDMTMRQEVPHKHDHDIQADGCMPEVPMPTPTPITMAVTYCRSWYAQKMKCLSVGQIKYWYRLPESTDETERKIAARHHQRQAIALAEQEAALAEQERKEEERLQKNREDARQRYKFSVQLRAMELFVNSRR